MSSRPDQSGLGREDVTNIGVVEEDLRQAVSRHLDRIRAGEEPLILSAAEAGEVLAELSNLP